MEPSITTAATSRSPRTLASALRRLGWLGFGFFLLKGIAWLIVMYVGYDVGIGRG